MDFQINCEDPPLEALILLASSKEKVNVQGSNLTNLIANSNVKFSSNISAMRYLANIDTKNNWMGNNALERCEVNHWITFSVGPLSCKNTFDESLTYLDRFLAPVTYLVSNHCTLADIVVWSRLTRNNKWVEMMKSNNTPVNLTRWYCFIGDINYVQSAVLSLQNLLKTFTPRIDESYSKPTETLRKEEGKFVELPGAEMGKVVVRFPPEASGYLHIGHAKAALLNQYYKDSFNGKLIMRFDDTNPAKEKADFEKVILEDLDLLEIKYDKFTRTSNYFDLLIEMCEKLIKEGKAYVDDTNAEDMKNEREKKICSKNRQNSLQKNLAMWNEMKNGTAEGQRCCVRAKIDMSSLNGCMRDPTIYRCKNEVHPQTGDKYKVYPTYDFACPIVDSIEGVTHCLRTMEYHDRDEQFYWFIDALGLRKPYIWEYSRLNMTNTVLSKRKLTWFVENRYVNGWDDPRMPTVRGVLRRGMTVEGLKQFIIAQGSSRAVVLMEWDKIWAINKKVIDPIAPRYTVVDATNNVLITVSSVSEESMQVALHPKNSEVGDKKIWISSQILIDHADALEFKENENVTFINWGNIMINKIRKDSKSIKEILATPNIKDKNYKKTLKITWLAKTEKAPHIPVICIYFDHLISKAILSKEEDFKQYVKHQTIFKVEMFGEPELASVKKGDIIQLQRKGFFICDEPYLPLNEHTCKENPIVLIYIPDGHSKAMPNMGFKSTLRNEVENICNKDMPELVAQLKEQSDCVKKILKANPNHLIIQKETDKLLQIRNNCQETFFEQLKPQDSKKENEVVESNNKCKHNDLLQKIADVGNKIRLLKSEKAEKSVIQENVKILVELKTSYKAATGQEWKPDLITNINKQTDEKETNKVNTKTQISQEIANSIDLKSQIAKVSENLKKLLETNADKNQIIEEQKILTLLKSKFKELTGSEWTESTNKEQIDNIDKSNSVALSGNIKQQGDKIRELKKSKVEKHIIDKEVKILLSLKSDYKNVTGKDWVPGDLPVNQKEKLENKRPCSNSDDIVVAKIKEQGDIVRKLKSSSNISKEEVCKAVENLLALKAEYKELTGQEYQLEGRNQGSNKKHKGDKTEANKKPPQKTTKQDSKSKVENKNDVESGPKKVTRLGLEAKKEENLPEWYSQIIVKSELIEYYDVSGCYILRPWSFAIWEIIKEWFDERIKLLGVKNCYFPIFVSKNALEKEKAHIADFSPEVAWVTKSGDSDMSEPVAIRPTSETVMYPAYAKWIQSYRDLPLKLNQWNNVVRWEFKHPQPFLRTREFLWQEGHTAFANYKEAEEEVYSILDLYEAIYTELMAIPVVKGRKTEKEKFAGGNYTFTVEAYISASGRAIQGATSHHLGQNFSKMFDIIYEDPETQEKKFVYQNSWGITTRTIGVLIMVHADNQGLVLPPNIASIQVIIVPCGVTVNLKVSEKQKLMDACKNVQLQLKDVDIRADVDLRDNYSPGWKFNHWELKGVPIRIEIGPKDLQKQQVIAVRRDNGEKVTISIDNLTNEIKTLLKTIQASLLSKATNELKEHIVMCKEWDTFCKELDNKNLLLSPFCGSVDCETKIKKDSARSEDVDVNAPSMGAKSLCTPFDQPAEIQINDKCIYYPSCKLQPIAYTLFGRSY